MLLLLLTPAEGAADADGARVTKTEDSLLLFAFLLFPFLSCPTFSFFLLLELLLTILDGAADTDGATVILLLMLVIFLDFSLSELDALVFLLSLLLLFLPIDEEIAIIAVGVLVSSKLLLRLFFPFRTIFHSENSG